MSNAAAKSPDLGLLVLRLALGVILLFHGVSKLLHGVAWIQQPLAALGLPGVLAYGAYLAELIAPVLLIVGMWTRIAAVAVRALREDGHAGRDYVLTGPESLSQAEQVRTIGDAIGREIRFTELSPEEFRLDTAGLWPARVVDMLLAAWAAAMGQPAYVTSTVADLLGRPARTFRTWAGDHSEAFHAGSRVLGQD